MLRLFDRFLWHDVKAMRVRPDFRQPILMEIAVRLHNGYGDTYASFN
jgi:hypothetical protein